MNDIIRIPILKEGFSMEEILKQILHEIQGLKENQDKLESTMNTGFSNTDRRIDNLSDRIEMHDKSNKEEFKQVSKKLDGITEVVAQTMEDITKLKDKVEKQDVEIRVIKGGR